MEEGEGHTEQMEKGDGGEIERVYVSMEKPWPGGGRVGGKVATGRKGTPCMVLVRVGGERDDRRDRRKI